MIMEENLRVCRRCLLSELQGEEALLAIVQERISLLPEDLRTGEEAYASRLAICKDCEQLAAGTCRTCGCYVELRASRQAAHCPAVPRKW